MRPHTFEIPDAILVWETEFDIEPERFVVRALVAPQGETIFERTYEVHSHDDPEGFIYDADDAKREAAEEFAAKLRELLA